MTPTKRAQWDQDVLDYMQEDSDGGASLSSCSSEWRQESDSDEENMLGLISDSATFQSTCNGDSFENVRFVWVEPNKISRAVLHPFNQERAGEIKTPLGDSATPISYFKEIFTPKFLQIIVDETNRQKESEPDLEVFWKNISIEELQIFFGLLLLMGHRIQEEYAEYWSTDELMQAPVFERVLPFDRFESIVDRLSFSNSNNAPNKDDAGYDRLWKLRPVLCLLNARFKELYNPTENMSINEVIVTCKGRIAFRQHTRKKRKQSGIKLYKLCDTNAYTYAISLYPGKSMMEKSMSPAHSLALDLTTSLLGKGHKVYMDHWFTSPMLFADLSERKVGACGTVRTGQKCMPEHFTMKELHLKQGEYKAYYCKGITAMCYAAKREVCFLSTIHNPPDEQNFRDKPEIVQAYIKQMETTDQSDRLANSYTFTRKTDKWSKKLFFHFLDLAVLNAFILMRSEKKSVTYKAFRLDLIRELLRHHVNACNSLIQQPQVPSDKQGSQRLEVQKSEHWPTKGDGPRRCKVCSANERGRKSIYYCPKCNVGLCIAGCFATYHTKVDYSNLPSTF